ncbi:hypothetical protein NPIL_541551 [Nephila pilipes]|uniref:Uncharacterized protein n=1 Tax=Nephila pilipes TaxID=299642 RepID=A0A8X6NTV4_NEPPI|nr:hypothetical protein NPIL_541551 [Nephila pilipes]
MLKRCSFNTSLQTQSERTDSHSPAVLNSECRRKEFDFKTSIPQGSTPGRAFSCVSPFGCTIPPYSKEASSEQLLVGFLDKFEQKEKRKWVLFRLQL